MDLKNIKPYYGTYFVTLNMRSNRKALRTENPNEPCLQWDQITSNMDPNITMQSKRLNAD